MYDYPVAFNYQSLQYVFRVGVMNLGMETAVRWGGGKEGDDRFSRAEKDWLDWRDPERHWFKIL
jgi:hypothetical protein